MTNFYFFTQFVDNFSSSASFKAAYFTELGKYRKANPLFEINKREGHKFTPDVSFSKEVRAAQQYRIAKSRGVILVSQNW